MFDSIGEKAGRFLISSSNGAPPVYIFVNSLKATEDEITELMFAAEAKPKKIEQLCGINLFGCLRIDAPAALQNPKIKEAMMLGKFLIADVASQAIATYSMQSANNPQSMLEVCAGKGNKTLMFQSLANSMYGHQLDITTIENVESKTKIMRERAKRYGANIERAIVTDATSKTAVSRELGKQTFDLIFIDAPCSGLGTLRRHPELKWRLTQKKIDELANTGSKILSNISSHVCDGGILGYATCTVTKSENAEVVENFKNSKIGQKFSTSPFFYTQTFTGLNDSHFLSLFQRHSTSTFALNKNL